MQWQAESRSTESAFPPWSPTKRFIFRFGFVYFAFYYGSAIGDLPGWPDRLDLPTALWRRSLPWIGRRLFHVTVVPEGHGSGDNLYAYLHVACCALGALVGALAWSALSRRREHTRLAGAMRVVLRYFLAVIMLDYGLAKVLNSQFPAPSLIRLSTTFGEASPMGLLWRFMGASTVYTFFGGATEVIGGLLLFWRRTTTLGALVLLGVIGNVVMLNLCYDVPVKLYSMHLWLTAVVLVLPDAPRLFDVLVRHRAVDGGAPRWQPAAPAYRRLRVLIKTAVILYLVIATVRSDWRSYRRRGSGAARPPLYGLYEVEWLSENGVARPLLVTDAHLWRRLAIDEHQRLYVRRMDDSTERYEIKDDAAARRISLRPTGGGDTSTFAYTRPDAQHLTLDGRFGAVALVARLRKLDDDQHYLLVTRGFHWINEAPFNQ